MQATNHFNDARKRAEAAGYLLPDSPNPHCIHPVPEGGACPICAATRAFVVEFWAQYEAHAAIVADLQARLAAAEAEIECFRVRVEVAERDAAEIYLKGSYVNTEGHLDNCPTFYDWCRCTVGTLEHNIQRAQKAEAALLAFRATVADALVGLWAEYEAKSRAGQDYNFIYGAFVDQLDATIAALGLQAAESAEGEVAWGLNSGESEVSDE